MWGFKKIKLFFHFWDASEPRPLRAWCKPAHWLQWPCSAAEPQTRCRRFAYASGMNWDLGKRTTLKKRSKLESMTRPGKMRNYLRKGRKKGKIFNTFSGKKSMVFWIHTWLLIYVFLCDSMNRLVTKATWPITTVSHTTALDLHWYKYFKHQVFTSAYL